MDSPLASPTLWPWSDPEIDGLDIEELPRGYARARVGRTGAIACVIGEDANGVLVDTFGPNRIAVGYDVGFAVRGVVVMPSLVNLAPAAFTAAWAASGATITPAAAIGPDGYKTAALVSSTKTQGYLLGPLPLGGAGTIYVAGFVKAATAHDARVTTKDAADVDVDSLDFAVTTTWQPFSVPVSWDGSTGGIGKIMISGSATGSAEEIYLSPLVYVGTARAWLGAIPLGSPGATAPVLDVSTLTERANRGGELAVDFHALDSGAPTIGTLRNAVNANDKRELRITAGTIAGDHADSAAAITSATIASPSIDTSERWTARARWNRAGLADGTSSEFSSVRAEQGAVADTATGRSATWTASTTPVTKVDIGHDDGADVLAGLVFGVSVESREPRL